MKQSIPTNKQLLRHALGSYSDDASHRLAAGEEFRILPHASWISLGINIDASHAQRNFMMVGTQQPHPRSLAVTLFSKSPKINEDYCVRVSCQPSTFTRFSLLDSTQCGLSTNQLSITWTEQEKPVPLWSQPVVSNINTMRGIYSSNSTFQQYQQRQYQWSDWQNSLRIADYVKWFYCEYLTFAIIPYCKRVLTFLNSQQTLRSFSMGHSWNSKSPTQRNQGEREFLEQYDLPQKARIQNDRTAKRIISHKKTYKWFYPYNFQRALQSYMTAKDEFTRDEFLRQADEMFSVSAEYEYEQRMPESLQIQSNFFRSLRQHQKDFLGNVRQGYYLSQEHCIYLDEIAGAVISITHQKWMDQLDFVECVIFVKAASRIICQMFEQYSHSATQLHRYRQDQGPLLNSLEIMCPWLSPQELEMFNNGLCLPIQSANNVSEILSSLGQHKRSNPLLKALQQWAMMANNISSPEIKPIYMETTKKHGVKKLKKVLTDYLHVVQKLSTGSFHLELQKVRRACIELIGSKAFLLLERTRGVCNRSVIEDIVQHLQLIQKSGPIGFILVLLEVRKDWQKICDFSKIEKKFQQILPLQRERFGELFWKLEVRENYLAYIRYWKAKGKQRVSRSKPQKGATTTTTAKGQKQEVAHVISIRRIDDKHVNMSDPSKYSELNVTFKRGKQLGFETFLIPGYPYVEIQGIWKLTDSHELLRKVREKSDLFLHDYNEVAQRRENLISNNSVPFGLNAHFKEAEVVEQSSNSEANPFLRRIILQYEDSEYCNVAAIHLFQSNKNNNELMRECNVKTGESYHWNQSANRRELGPVMNSRFVEHLEIVCVGDKMKQDGSPSFCNKTTVGVAEMILGAIRGRKATSCRIELVGCKTAQVAKELADKGILNKIATENGIKKIELIGNKENSEVDSAGNIFSIGQDGAHVLATSAESESRKVKFQYYNGEVINVPFVSEDGEDEGKERTMTHQKLEPPSKTCKQSLQLTAERKVAVGEPTTSGRLKRSESGPGQTSNHKQQVQDRSGLQKQSTVRNDARK